MLRRHGMSSVGVNPTSPTAGRSSRSPMSGALHPSHGAGTQNAAFGPSASGCPSAANPKQRCGSSIQLLKNLSRSTGTTDPAL